MKENAEHHLGDQQLFEGIDITLKMKNSYYEEMFTDAIKSVRDDPTNAGRWSWLAGMFSDVIKEQEHKGRCSAVTAMRRAIKLNPNDPMDWETLGDCLLMINSHLEAVNSFLKSLEIEPNHPRAEAWRRRIREIIGHHASMFQDEMTRRMCRESTIRTRLYIFIFLGGIALMALSRLF